MATINWIGNAHDVRQICTVTVAGTINATETGTLTINGKDLVITAGSTTTTTALFATAIKEAWNAFSYLDGSSASSNATSNFGGQEFGEFAEVTASVSGSVVTLVANTPGKPFTVSVADTLTGSLTLATPTAATGKHFWNNGDNWSGGSAPSNDDIVVFKDTDVSCLYGLPNGSLEVTMQVWRSFTGEIGLPVINVDGIHYYEYRQRYVRLDDAGGGSDIAHRFGLGTEGRGSRMINLKHSTVKCSPVVYWTGVPLAERNGKALNICCTANTSTINILSGSVDFSSQDSGTSAFLTIKQTGGDSRGITAVHTTNGAVTVSGGSMVIGGAGAIAGITANAGSLRLEGQTGTVSAITVNGASVDIASSLTVSACDLLKGSLDLRNDAGTVTFTVLNWYGGDFHDPSFRRSVNTFALYFDPVPGSELGLTSINGTTIG